MSTDYRWINPEKGWPDGVNKCMYCWQTDHYLKRYCQAFQDDLNSSRFHLGDEGRVCLGAYTPRALSVLMRREKPGRESVADAEKLRNRSLPLANVQTVRIRKANPKPYTLEEETE